MMADMNLSIDYLEKAIESTQIPGTDQSLIPLAETYLNLANGYAYLSRYDQALVCAKKALKFALQRSN